MKHLVLIGPQGSGKGTQARLLAAEFGFVIFETGAALREIAARDTPLGQQVKAITTRGDLVPTEIVMKIVENFIETHPNQLLIFDGIPRSDEQRIALETLFGKHNIDFQVVEIAVPIEQCLERLTQRATIEGRADDTPEAIKTRLKNFFTYTEPLLEYWAHRGQLFTVKGEATPEEVHKDIKKALSL